MATPIPLPDTAFVLPLFISDDPECDYLVTLYNVIVHRMRSECEHFAISTIAELLIERIAYNYIIIRWRERKTNGEPGAFEHTTASKDFNNFWLSMTKEFNSMTRFSDESYRKQLVATVNQAISKAMEGMAPAAAGPLRQALADAFQEAGL
jgi:hypothetical protein